MSSFRTYGPSVNNKSQPNIIFVDFLFREKKKSKIILIIGNVLIFIFNISSIIVYQDNHHCFYNNAIEINFDLITLVIKS